MRKACFTVDLDRDVNFPPEAGGMALSLDRGSGTSPRFSSSRKGAEILAGLFNEIGIKGTFFAESAALKETAVFDRIEGNEIALHGRDHEDLTRMDLCDAETMLSDASDAIADITGKRPAGFRAPYMKIGDGHYAVLEKIGIRYDSSRYAPIGTVPYRIGDITEIPVTESTDRSGKRVTAYLWPMHEGERSPDDYVEMASRMKDGVFVLATHTWHMPESRKSGLMSDKETAKNTENVRKVIEGITDLGYSFGTMESLLF